MTWVGTHADSRGIVLVPQASCSRELTEHWSETSNLTTFPTLVSPQDATESSLEGVTIEGDLDRIINSERQRWWVTVRSCKDIGYCGLEKLSIAQSILHSRWLVLREQVSRRGTMTTCGKRSRSLCRL
jgi:hypothetical protein